MKQAITGPSFLAVSCRPSLWGCVGAVCVLLLFVSVGQAAGQSLGWAKQAVGADFDYASAVAVDGSGNVYVTGPYNRQCGCGSSLTFDGGGPNETTLPGLLSADVFVAKYNSSGALVWAKSASTFGYDESFGIAVDAEGNSYVAIVRSGIGAQVVKFDSSGSEVWTTTLPLSGYAYAIALDAAGNSYITGYGADIQTGGTLATVWKLDSGGAPLWTRQATGVHSGGGTAIAVDSAGNSYAAGHITGDATFGAGEPGETMVSGDVMFLAKYTSSGSLVWVHQTTNASAGGIALDAGGRIHVTGSTGLGGAIFGMSEPNETSVLGAFLAKFAVNGQLLWARSIWENVSTAGAGVAVDLAGHSLVTGSILGASFTANYDPDGNLVWLRQPSNDQSTGGGSGGGGIATDNDGNAYVVGALVGTVIFGAGEPSQVVLSSSSIIDRDIFVAKYRNDESVGNRPPVADDQTVGTPEDTPLAITLTATDPDGDPLTYSIVSGPTHGTPDVANLPSVIYTPNANYNGPDAFTFRVCDATDCDDATVTITVSPVNDPPFPHSQFVSTPQDVPVTIVLSGSDVDGDPLTFHVVNGAAHGVVAPTDTSGPVVYTPQPGYVGDDAFVFRAHDGTEFGPVLAIVSLSVRSSGFACGARISGSITAPAEVDTYTFAGQAGQIISMALASTGGFTTNQSQSSASLTLFTPSGAILGALRSNNQATFTLPVDGTYVVQVRATNLRTLGSYNVTRHCLFPPTGAPVLQCGVLQPGSIGVPGEVDLYSFTGQAGQIVGLSLASTGGFNANQTLSSAALTLFTPTGALLGAIRSNGQANFALPATGTYVVRVNATNLATIGTYNVSLQCLLPPTPAPLLQCGALQSGSIGAPGEVDLYSFTGQAGQIIGLTLASTAGFTSNQTLSSAALTLFTPTGALLGAFRSNSQANFMLPATGTYVVRVNATNLATTGTYNVSVQCLLPTPTPAPLLQCGVPQPGTIAAPGEVDLYSFTSQAGQIVGLTLASTGGFTTNRNGTSAALTLFAPTGALLGAFRSNGQANFTLPATGTYVVRVNATNLATTGSYNVGLQCPA
jgi:Big-like domain-containing protein/pre-peptidase